MVLALIGGVLWLLRQGNPSVVVVPDWAMQDVEAEEDLSAWE
jgi:hypothetical protein